MLPRLALAGQPVDALDLKVLLIGAGVRVPDETYRRFAASSRLADPTNLMACNCVILPGGVAAHLTANDESPFSVGVSAAGRACLEYQGQLVTEVDFPAHTAFYEQRTR